MASTCTSLTSTSFCDLPGSVVACVSLPGAATHYYVIGASMGWVVLLIGSPRFDDPPIPAVDAPDSDDP